MLSRETGDLPTPCMRRCFSLPNTHTSQCRCCKPAFLPSPQHPQCVSFLVDGPICTASLTCPAHSGDGAAAVSTTVASSTLVTSTGVTSAAAAASSSPTVHATATGPPLYRRALAKAEPAPSSSSEGQPPLYKRVQAHAWVCRTCQSECIPIRSESRCLCGHRLKEHGGHHGSIDPMGRSEVDPEDIPLQVYR